MNIIIKYQRIINMLDNASNLSCKFTKRNSVKINHGVRGIYNTNKQINFKTWMLISNLYDYSDD